MSGNYPQELDLYAATLTTQFSFRTDDSGAAAGARSDGTAGLCPVVHLIQFFSRKHKNLLVFRIHVYTDAPFVYRLHLKPIVDFISHYNYRYRAEVETFPGEKTNGSGRPVACVIRSNATKTEAALLPLAVKSGGVLPERTGALEWSWRFEGSGDAAFTLAIVNELDPVSMSELYSDLAAVSYEEVYSEHAGMWDAYWHDSLISISSEYPLQKMWLRSNYYFGASEADFETYPLTPGGFAGSKCWPYYFPQDYLYVYQNYLTMNHKPQREATARYWHRVLPQVEEYTRRLLSVDGAFYPWSPALFDWSRLHVEGVPNRCYYELHNSAYVARICWEYYRYSCDSEYLKTSGYPVIRRIADFYAAISTYDDKTGRYEIVLTPNMGQDELGGMDAPNYFCTLMSAAYSIKTAIDAAAEISETPDPKWSEIHSAGYAFEKLESGGVFIANEAVESNEGRQKHRCS